MSKINSIMMHQSEITKYAKYQLPHRFKRIGLVVFILSFIMLFVNAFLIDNQIFREIIKYGLLISLLVISISKEPVEDEMIVQLRMQSYTFAFIAGIILALFQPFADYFVDLLLEKEATFNINASGDWVILWVLLFTQVAVFETLRKKVK